MRTCNKKFGDAAPPQELGISNALPRVTVLNLVVLGQMLRAHVKHRKMGLSRPAFQGHWNQHGSIGNL